MLLDFAWAFHIDDDPCDFCRSMTGVLFDDPISAFFDAARGCTNPHCRCVLVRADGLVESEAWHGSMD
jgi:hypothetical protein